MYFRFIKSQTLTEFDVRSHVSAEAGVVFIGYIGVSESSLTPHPTQYRSFRRVRYCCVL